jgi:hypothetical protein
METAATTTTNSNMLDVWNSDNRSVLSSCKRLKTSIAHIPPLPSADTKATTQIPTLEDIPSELFIRHILPFVGRHQYRFVAAVNRNFHTAYVTAFPKKVTRVNVSTIEHAKICFAEKKGNYHHPCILCRMAAREGNLSVLKYLRSIHCSWYRDTCANAAKNGHLDVIQWCHSNGFPWDAKTCHNAAGNGHIDILKWCRQNGCEWWQSTCEALESKGYFDVLQWSFENGCKCIVCSKYGNLD